MKKTVLPYTLKTEQLNFFNSSVKEIGYGSPKIRDNKIHLVDKYFLDKRTGFRRICLISLVLIDRKFALIASTITYILNYQEY